MEMRDLSLLKVLVDRAIAERAMGLSGVLTNEELDHLKRVVSIEQHCKEVHDFREKLVKAMPASFENEEVAEAFYNKEFTITFGNADNVDMSVTFGNCATVYNGVLDLIDEYIANDL